MRRDRDLQGGAARNERWGTGGESGMEDSSDDPLAFDTVILPARVDADVARRVAIASNRDGVSVADLLGRAAAAYDWQIDDESGDGRPRAG